MLQNGDLVNYSTQSVSSVTLHTKCTNMNTFWFFIQYIQINIVQSNLYECIIATYLFYTTEYKYSNIKVRINYFTLRLNKKYLTKRSSILKSGTFIVE